MAGGLAIAHLEHRGELRGLEESEDDADDEGDGHGWHEGERSERGAQPERRDDNHGARALPPHGPAREDDRAQQGTTCHHGEQECTHARIASEIRTHERRSDDETGDADEGEGADDRGPAQRHGVPEDRERPNGVQQRGGFVRHLGGDSGRNRHEGQHECGQEIEEDHDLERRCPGGVGVVDVGDADDRGPDDVADVVGARVHRVGTGGCDVGDDATQLRAPRTGEHGMEEARDARDEHEHAERPGADADSECGRAGGEAEDGERIAAPRMDRTIHQCAHEGAHDARDCRDGGQDQGSL